MTDAEQAIVNRMREVEEKIAALEKDQASILEQRGIVSQAMPEPEAVDATATFPNQDTGRKRRLIEEARQQIADINDIDINDVKMRYADGKTTLTKQEKRFVNFGKKLGITVVFVQTPGNSTMAGAYKNGVVFLSAQDINRPSAMFAIAMHETVHYLHESNPELFRGLYNALNKRVPRALRELRKSYTARLDQVSRVNAVRRAGLIMLNDENESSRDAVLWVARNDDSPEAALLRANMPDQLAAALDDQDLSALTTPTDDVAAEYRKEFKKRFTGGLRAPLSESQLQQEEIANLAELVMDGAFVTIVGDDGKINIDEVRRLADTKPTISRFAALASAIMDAFTIIPGMTKKARGLNDAQVAALRKFADNPKELASPRTRNVAQQLIAQSLVKMMDAKRGNIPAGEIGASPMSDELAGARIPALDFSIRLAVPDDGRSVLFAGEDRELPAVDPATPSRISKESLDFAIRAIASDDKPTELKLVNNQIESNKKGATKAGFANTEDGRRWYIKHLVGRISRQEYEAIQRVIPGNPADIDTARQEIQFEGVRKYHLQNELAANLMAESLGMPGVMPIRGFYVTKDGTVLDVQASEVLPGFQTLRDAKLSGENIPWETTMRAAAVSSILGVSDTHENNVTSQGTVFDLGGSLGVPAVPENAYSIPFISVQARFRSARDEGTTSENALQFKAIVRQNDLIASLYEDRNTVVNGLDPSLTAALAHTADFGPVINKAQNLLPVSRYYANKALEAFARNYAEAQSLSDPTARLEKIRRYLAGSLFNGLRYGYNAPAVRQAGDMLQVTKPEERPNISRVLRDLAQQFSEFANSGDALAALEAVQLGRGYPFMDPSVARRLRNDIATAVRTRALMMSNFYNTLATLNDGEPAFDEAAVTRAKLESMGEEESINFSIRRAPETAEFQRWFGDSKVVDEQGRPLVVYHATRAAKDFGEFKITKDLGFHFTPNPDSASRALQTRVGGATQAGGARIYPVYLSIKNPIRIEETGSVFFGDIGGWEFGELINQFYRKTKLKESNLFRYEPERFEYDAPEDMDFREAMRAGLVTKTQARPGLIDETTLQYTQRINREILEQYGELPQKKRNSIALKRFADDVRKLGFDGFVYKNIVERGGDSWIALDSNQIKSAFNQRPTASPNISFAIRRIPQEVIDTAGVENSIAAAQSQKFKSIRDFKLVIQKQVRDAATRNNTTVHDTRQ
jgi:hypothetical protein